ncbi:hypothetical protein LTS18_011012, partial [Coniosporium uncinatum]
PPEVVKQGIPSLAPPQHRHFRGILNPPGVPKPSLSPALKSTKSTPKLAARPSKSTPSSPTKAKEQQRPELKPKKSVEEVWGDRYNGGLQYNYESGVGVGGSAGTRSLRTAASRKSLENSFKYGIDLSDVPVFLRRVS